MASLQQRTEIRDGMRIDWDVPITMDDGLVLRADVFRPVKDGQYPVILSYGPYAKSLAFQDGYPSAWQRMARSIPTSPPDRATSTRAGKWSTRRNGCRTITSACASIHAAPAARPASSIISRRARPRISTTASNGRACSPGRTAKSASTAFPITASTSGTSPRCSRRISPPCASGKAPPTGTAT